MTPAIGQIVALRIYPVKGCHGIALDRALLVPEGLADDRRWMIVRADGRFLTQRELPALATIRPALAEDRLLLRLDGGPELALPLDDRGERLKVQVWRDSVDAVAPDPAVDRALSDHLGRDCRIVRFPDGSRRPVDPAFAPPSSRTRFADGFPLLVTSEGSLAALNDVLLEAGEEAVPMTRFRPSLVLGGVPAGSEDEFGRLEIGAGTAALDLVKPCDRCIVTTTDQDTGERMGAEPMRTLRRIRRNPATGGAWFGQNAVPDLVDERPVTIRVGMPCRLERPRAMQHRSGPAAGDALGSTSS